MEEECIKFHFRILLLRILYISSFFSFLSPLQDCKRIKDGDIFFLFPPPFPPPPPPSPPPSNSKVVDKVPLSPPPCPFFLGSRAVRFIGYHDDENMANMHPPPIWRENLIKKLGLYEIALWHSVPKRIVVTNVAS